MKDTLSVESGQEATFYSLASVTLWVVSSMATLPLKLPSAPTPRSPDTTRAPVPLLGH